MNGGDTCAAALDATTGGTFPGTTDTATDDYGPSGTGCPAGGSASGRDVAYRLSPSVTTNYTVTVTPMSSSFDPMLYVQQTCGGTGCVTGTVLNGAGQPESLTFTVQGGATVYLVVDGELVSKGPFTLVVQGT